MKYDDDLRVAGYELVRQRFELVRQKNNYPREPAQKLSFYIFLIQNFFGNRLRVEIRRLLDDDGSAQHRLFLAQRRFVRQRVFAKIFVSTSGSARTIGDRKQIHSNQFESV